MTWRALQGKRLYGKRPEVGQIIAYEHRPWRVLEVASLSGEADPESELALRGVPYRMTLRPAGTVTIASHHDDDVSLRVPGGYWFEALPEHYALCIICQDLPPCRHDVQEAATAQAMATMGRYEHEGVCPACEEVVTSRQRFLAFPVNLKFPGGPPVVFHERQKCRWSAVEYDKEWARLEDRPARLSCEGMLMRHGAGEGHCALATCPGPGVVHRSMSMCGCLEFPAGTLGFSV